ncbi:MAG: hypothetical protein R2713_18130 [Ilumatobacteraceae bacterium]
MLLALVIGGRPDGRGPHPLLVIALILLVVGFFTGSRSIAV